MKNIRDTRAVSEILGTVLLLAIAVASVSIIYIQVLGSLTPTDTTNVTIIGKIEQGRPVFELQRGESLGADTKILIILGGFERWEFLQKDLGSQEWNIGGQIVLPVDVAKGIKAEATIVDTITNEMVYRGVLQEGFTFGFKGGIWHFDEPEWTRAFNEVIDSSPNNNHGRSIDGARISTGIVNNGGYFDGFMDAVKVNTSWTLDLRRYISIEAWMKPEKPQFIADIADIKGTFGFTPYIIAVSDEIYVYISEEQSKGCHICTVRIDSEGVISDIEDLTLVEKSTGSTLCRPRIIQMTKNTFLIAFIDNNYKVNLQTIDISTNGSIKIIDKLKFTEESDRNDPNTPSLQKITDNICAIAYWTEDEGGILKTVEISSTADIIYNGDQILYDAPSSNYSRSPCLAHVNDDIYTLSYRGPSNHGFLKTFNISSDGNIIYTGEVLEFETAAYEPSLVQVSERAVAVAYRNTSDNGIVKTFDISSDGSITWTDNIMIFENTSNCFNPWIIHGKDDNFIIAYSTKNDAKGFVYRLKIDEYGLIIPVENPRQQIRQQNTTINGQNIPNPEKVTNPIIIHISEELYAISYTGGVAHEGLLMTILIGPHGRGIYKGESYQLFANLNMVEGYINHNYIYYYSNTSLGLNWHLFTLTYDGISICLYLDGNKVNETSYPLHRIDLTNAPLYFGRFYCGYIDEIAIYDKVLTQEQILNHFMNPGTFEYYF